MTDSSRDAPRDERPRIRLSTLSHGAGWACKLGPAELAQVLRFVPQTMDPGVLVDASTGDDAAVVRLAADRALVLSTDFFTPLVDDAYDYGAIAAANALSDIYAMGARPLYALNIVAWPRQHLDLLGDVLRGGADTVTRAGAAIVGGHSIDDPEPKYGLVAVGEVHPDRVVTNAGGRPGDALVLTKPIGTGIITTALKRGTAPERAVAAAVRSMTTLNADAARIMLEIGADAATDVTGFGLLGHLAQLARASGLAAEIWASAVPRLPEVRRLAEEGNVPGGTERNLTAANEVADFDATLDGTERTILADAQTSGGLLIATPPAQARSLLAALGATGSLAAAHVGILREGDPGAVAVRAAPPG